MPRPARRPARTAGRPRCAAAPGSRRRRSTGRGAAGRDRGSATPTSSRSAGHVAADDSKPARDAGATAVVQRSAPDAGSCAVTVHSSVPAREDHEGAVGREHGARQRRAGGLPQRDRCRVEGAHETGNRGDPRDERPVPGGRHERGRHERRRRPAPRRATSGAASGRSCRGSPAPAQRARGCPARSTHSSRSGRPRPRRAASVQQGAGPPCPDSRTRGLILVRVPAAGSSRRTRPSTPPADGPAGPRGTPPARRPARSRPCRWSTRGPPPRRHRVRRRSGGGSWRPSAPGPRRAPAGRRRRTRGCDRPAPCARSVTRRPSPSSTSATVRSTEAESAGWATRSSRGPAGRVISSSGARP